MKDKIPKIIHYFYDADNEIYKKDIKPQLRICYTSWKRFCPDYKIMLWHYKMPEFQELLKQSKFLRKAYKLKIWAFVSDYIRLYALYNYGGIYVDTDIQIIKPLDNFLTNELFMSYLPNLVEPALIGATKGHPEIKKILDFYNSKEIFQEENVMANITFKKFLKNIINIPEKVYPNIEEYKNQKTLTTNNITLYPDFYFAPNWEMFKDKSILENTHAIHWNQSSWWYTKKNRIDAYELCHVEKTKGLRKIYRKLRILIYRIINSCY